MRTIVLLLMLGFSQIGIGQHVPMIFIGGYTPRSGEFPFVNNESIATVLNRTSAITLTSNEIERYNRGEPIRDVKINLYRDKKLTVLAVDQKDLWTRKVQVNDTYEFSRSPFSFFILKAQILKPPGDEQPGADQPATQPAEKAPVKDQPSPPTSKDAPR